ncbi:MAG: hypothetical protein AAGG38_11530 [Planctomycetota bacterium]
MGQGETERGGAGAQWRAWRDAAARPGVDDKLRELYAELDASVAARGPTCWASGECCRFEAYGHRLYVTGLEIAWFLGQVERGAGTGAEAGGNRGGGRAEGGGVRLPQFAEEAGSCPYQVGGRCGEHGVRPMGCRVFFCQAGTEAWQQALYEDFLGRLRGLHEAEGVAYRYMDWIAGLNEAGGAGPRGGG